MRFSKDVLNDAQIRIQKFIKGEHRLPSYVSMKDMDTGKLVEVKQPVYSGLFFNYYTFWLKNGRFPNYVTANTTKTNPMVLNYQDTSYTCCPTSLSMVSTKLFKPVSEGVLAQILGTNKANGTPEVNLVNYAPRAGFKATPIARNPTVVKEALDKYNGVLTHYQTGPANCSGFINDYGHYAVLEAVVDGRYRVYDPTKGVYYCKTGEMDKATNGRAIYYFSVELL